MWKEGAKENADELVEVQMKVITGISHLMVLMLRNQSRPSALSLQVLSVTNLPQYPHCLLHHGSVEILCLFIQNR